MRKRVIWEGWPIFKIPGTSSTVLGEKLILSAFRWGIPGRKSTYDMQIVSPVCRTDICPTGKHTGTHGYRLAPWQGCSFPMKISISSRTVRSLLAKFPSRRTDTLVLHSQSMPNLVVSCWSVLAFTTSGSQSRSRSSSLRALRDLFPLWPCSLSRVDIWRDRWDRVKFLSSCVNFSENNANCFTIFPQKR